MSAPRARRALLLAFAAASAAALWNGRVQPDRAVLPAVEIDDFTALIGRSAESTPELWERLKAMGVCAVVLREESAAELAGRGDAMHFSRGEVEKWRALGLVASSAGPRPDSLWAKDAKALARLSSALAARGIDVSTAIAAGGVRVIELPPGVDLGRVPAGFDPESVAVVSSAGLIPVAASTSPVSMVAGRRFWIRTLPVTARRPQLLRAAHGRAMRLLILKPAPGAGLEETVESLRAALKVVRSALRWNCAMMAYRLPFTGIKPRLFGANSPREPFQIAVRGRASVPQDAVVAGERAVGAGASAGQGVAGPV